MSEQSIDRYPVAIIGAGPAGLATAAALRAKGVDSVVLERSGSVASSWRSHYDRLRLHTVRWMSGLPGMAIPRDEGAWVSRDGVVRYLEAYTEHHGITVRTDAAVGKVERNASGGTPANGGVAGGGGWVLRSPGGDVHADAVVVATGYNHTPVMPEVPGIGSYTGELRHAKDYRNGARYSGKDVLVVGPGNTGAEIAVDLTEHGARRVRLAIRSAPYILRRAAMGIPTQLTGVLMRRVPPRIGDALAEPVRKLSVPNLAHKGLADPGKGLYTRASAGRVPILDVGVVDAIKRDKVVPVAGLTGFEGPKVLLSDGSAIDPEVVIVAAGYRRGLEPLVGHLGVLRENGTPIRHGSQAHSAAPGLHFIGYTNPVSGMFREIAIDAKKIAATLSRRLAADRG